MATRKLLAVDGINTRRNPIELTSDEVVDLLGLDVATDVLTADGQLLVGETGAAPIALNPTTDGYILTLVAGFPRWRAPIVSLSSGSMVIRHNNLSEIQGGAAGDYYHLTNVELTKLGGIEINADVTDPANVAAAGAIMNTDLCTNGAILVGSSSGSCAPQELAPGNNGQVLTMVAGFPGWNDLPEHNELTGLQGGAPGEYFHLTSSEHAEATRYANSSSAGLMPSEYVRKLNLLYEYGNVVALGVSNAGVITKGDVVYYVGHSDILSSAIFAGANASDPTKMPAIGVAMETFSGNTQGKILLSGSLYNLDTSAWASQIRLYVGTTDGQLVVDRPGGNNKVQVIAQVGKSDASGYLYVSGALDLFDLPNLDEGHFWVGGSSSIPQEFDFTTQGGLLVGSSSFPFVLNPGTNGDVLMMHEGMPIWDDSAQMKIGFPNRTDTTISFDNGTRRLTIAPVGASFTYRLADGQHTIVGSKNVQITNTEGSHFVYYDSDETLKSTTTWVDDLILVRALVSIIRWDTTNGKALYVADERHLNMDPETHLHFHATLGALLKEGLALQDITADGNGGDAAHAEFSVQDGVIKDEDIEFDIVDDDPQDLSFPAQIPIYYRDGAGGKWRVKDADNYPLIYSDGVIFTGANGRCAYNLDTAGTWSLEEVPNNKFVLVHYYGTNNTLAPVIGIQGQTYYATKALAQHGATVEIFQLQLDGLPVEEFVALGTVVWKTRTAYANVPKVIIVTTEDGGDYVDWRAPRGVSTIAAQTAPHNGLAGLQGGAIGEYYHLTALEHSVLDQFVSSSSTVLDHNNLLGLQGGTVGED